MSRPGFVRLTSMRVVLVIACFFFSPLSWVSDPFDYSTDAIGEAL